MAYHPMLKYQIEKFLGEHPGLAPMLDTFLSEIDRTYQEYEFDRNKLKEELYQSADRETQFVSDDAAFQQAQKAALFQGDEQFFRRIVEATTEPIAVIGPAGEFYLANDAFHGLFGTNSTRQEYSFVAYLERESSHLFSSSILAALEHGGTWEGILHAHDTSARTFPLWFRCDAVLDDSNNILFIVAIMHDASSQDLVERTLSTLQMAGKGFVQTGGDMSSALQQVADALGRQNALLNCILDIAWLKDTNGKYLAVNKVFCRWFEKNEIEIIGNDDSELFDAATAIPLSATDREVLTHKRLMRKEISILGPGNRVYWCETVKIPSYNDRGEVTGIAGIMRDISIRKEGGREAAQTVPDTALDILKQYRPARESAPPSPAEMPVPPAEPVHPVVPREQTPPGESHIVDEHDPKFDLQQRDAIMAAITLAAEYFLRVPPWEKHIHEVLEWLGRATNVHRVYLFQNHKDEAGKLSAQQICDWVSSHAPSGSSDAAWEQFEYESQGFQRWINTMQSGDLILGNVSEFPDAERRHFAGCHAMSVVAVPIFVDGAWWGFLGFNEAVTERNWKPVIIDVLKTAANLIGAVIERERTEGTYRTMVEQSLQELLIAQNGRIVYANPEAIRNSDFSEQDLYRFGSTDIYTNVVAEDKEIISHALASIKTGRSDTVKVEFRTKKKDGKIRWVESLISVISYKGNPAIQLVQVDITERKRIELTLRERSTIDFLVGDLSARFINLPYNKIDGALTDALGVIAKYFKASRCYLFVIDETENTGRIANEWHEEDLEPIAPVVGHIDVRDLRWLHAKFLHAESALIQDVYAMPAEAEEEKNIFLKTGMVSLALIPVYVQGKVYGNMAIGYTQRVAEWQPDIVSALTIGGEIIVNVQQRKEAEESLLKTKERYKLATEAGNVGVWDWDLITDTIYIDPTLKSLIGYTDDEIPNDIRSWTQHVHPDDYPEVARRMQNIYEKEIQSYSTEQRMVHKNGGTVSFLVHGMVMSDEEGNPIRIIGTDTNITELKKAETALRESESKNAAIVQSLPDLVYILDRAGKYCNIMAAENNPQAAYANGFLNKTVFDILSVQSANRIVQKIGNVIDHGVVEVEEYEYYDPVVGEHLCFEARLSRLNATLVLVLTRDITERKRVEMEIVQNNETLKVRNEELDAFSHTVAHDLKNPLTLVIGYAGLLNEAASDMKPAEVKQYLSNILLNSKRMNSIIESLLLLAEVRQEDVELDELDMKLVVDEALSRLSYMIQEYMAVVVMPDEWPTAIGYSSWVEEVLVNYITNAMKYGGRPPKIELGADRRIPGFVRYWVKDNGKGIAQEDIDKLFSPLTRLGSGTIKGYGLGLSIVKRIIEKLDGRIGVESEIGKGSLFWFALPESKTK